MFRSALRPTQAELLKGQLTTPPNDRKQSREVENPVAGTSKPSLPKRPRMPPAGFAIVRPTDVAFHAIGLANGSDRRRAQTSINKAWSRRSIATNRTALGLPVPPPPFPQQATADLSGTSQEGILSSTLPLPRSMSQSESIASTRPESATPRTPTPGFPSQLPSTMQRDIDLTIGDIVLDQQDDSLSALDQISEHIVPQETHTNLRFLKIPHLKQYSDLYPEVTCKLTEKGDYPREKRYVAVSYCWESFNSLNNVDVRSSLLSPTVLVEQRGEPPRAPRCPAKVLTRAIAFAVHMGVSLIWIDQECVNQEDPADIENHLQCNHIIFSQAEFKIGVLSFQLSKRQVDELISLELFHVIGLPKFTDWRTRSLADFGLKSILRSIQSITRLLRSIARDRWFTRTWVFQERYSANMEMHLLLPLSTEALKKFDNPFNKELSGEDFPLDVTSICTIAAAIRLYLSEPELGQILQENLTVKDAVYESLNSLHEVAQLLSGPIFSGTSFDRVFQTIGLSTNPQKEISNVRNFPIYKTFLEMESCDNRVVSDRVAILSNVMGFQWRFPTKSFYSYSFALVALLSANSYLPSVLIQEETQTRPSRIFSHSVPASGLIILAYHMKELIAEGKEALQKEFENVSRALTNFFGRDITRHTEFRDAIENAVEDLPEASYEDPLLLLSKIEIQNLKRWDVVPLSATIGDLLGGIVADDHIDNVGLQFSHGETIVRHGVKTNQLKEGVTFMALVGEYRWRPKFIEKFFD